MAKLTAETRNALPEKAFALPGRRYPIHDINHARDALSRVSANGTPAEQAMVRAKVHAKFPGIHEGPEKQAPEDDPVEKIIKKSLASFKQPKE